MRGRVTPHMRCLLWLSAAGVAALLLLGEAPGVPAPAAAAADDGLLLSVTEVNASTQTDTGEPYFDPRLGKAILKTLKNSALGYNRYSYGGTSSRRLQPGGTAVFSLSDRRRMLVKTLPTSATRPNHASLDITIKDALHTQVFLRPGSSLLLHLPTPGAGPARGSIYVLALSGEVAGPEEPSPGNGSGAKPSPVSVPDEVDTRKLLP